MPAILILAVVLLIASHMTAATYQERSLIFLVVATFAALVAAVPAVVQFCKWLRSRRHFQVALFRAGSSIRAEGMQEFNALSLAPGMNRCWIGFRPRETTSFAIRTVSFFSAGTISGRSGKRVRYDKIHIRTVGLVDKNFGSVSAMQVFPLPEGVTVMLSGHYNIEQNDRFLFELQVEVLPALGTSWQGSLSVVPFSDYGSTPIRIPCFVIKPGGARPSRAMGKTMLECAEP